MGYQVGHIIVGLGLGPMIKEFKVLYEYGKEE